MAEPALIHQFLEGWARENGSHPCLIEQQDQILSYADVNALANRFGRFLRAGGLQPGDRVVFLLRNSHRYVAAYYGTLKAGGVAVPLNTSWSGAEVAWAVNHCAASLLVTEGRFAASLTSASVPRRVRCYYLTGTASTPEGLERLKLEDFGADDLGLECRADAHASIIYTSGSTGAPKGVVLTHRNVVENTRSILRYLRLTPADRGMAVLPFYYVYGKSVLNTHLCAGATVVIENRSAFPRVCLSKMSRLAVTGFSGVPSMFMILLNKGGIEDFDFPHLRYLTCAGGHLPVKYVDRLLATFPRAEVFIMYGATEASARISYVPPDRLRAKRGSIGVPIDGVEMRVMRDGQQVSPFEEGRIWARGENFSAGYWPLANGEDFVLRDGWYDTGDIGFQDTDGFYFLTGRANDFIKIGGHRVSALEIENSLYQLECVEECAVLGWPDETLGERAEAYVVLSRPGVAPETILQSLQSYLPPYKMPSMIVIVSTLPKNASGKIAKKVLYETMMAQQTEREERL